MADILKFPGITKLDLPVEQVLAGAVEHCPETILVIGFDRNGDVYLAGTQSDAFQALWLLEAAKLYLLGLGAKVEKS